MACGRPQDHFVIVFDVRSPKGYAEGVISKGHYRFASSVTAELADNIFDTVLE